VVIEHQALTGYRFNASHPRISSTAWNPSLAARTAVGAWRQFEEAAALDESAAIQAASWGAFQIMGFHFEALGYGSPQAMRADMDDEQGQLNAFVQFVQADIRLVEALKRHDWHTFAAFYNGPGQIDVYAGRIAEAYARAA